MAAVSIQMEIKKPTVLRVYHFRHLQPHARKQSTHTETERHKYTQNSISVDWGTVVAASNAVFFKYGLQAKRREVEGKRAYILCSARSIHAHLHKHKQHKHEHEHELVRKGKVTVNLYPMHV